MISKILQQYNKLFSFRKKIFESIHLNKWLLLFGVFILLSAISFVYFGSKKENLYMLFSALSTLLLISIACIQHEKVIQKRFGSRISFESLKRKTFITSINNIVNLKDNDQYDIFNDSINHRIEIEKRNSKFPFIRIFENLFIGILTSGLLAYSFQSIFSGKIEIGSQLLTLYLMVVGIMIMSAPLIYLTRDYTKVSKLHHIKEIINESRLEILRNKSQKKNRKINSSKK
jgi:hypothetical protein